MLRALPAAVPAAALVLLLLTPRADACPICERSYLLAPSVKSARNIYLGQVERAPQDQPAEVRVVKVLRGGLKRDQVIKVSLRAARYRLGRILLLSDPTSKPTNYPVLEPELEEEVRLLMQKKPRITSVAAAVRMVQGVSDEATAAGLRYIRRHRERATGPVIKAIEGLRPAIFSGRGAGWGRTTSWKGIRLERLVTALLSGVHARSPGYAKTRAYLLREVRRFLRHGWRDPNPKIVPTHPDVRGLYLRWLLSNTKARGRLRRAARRRLKRGYARLRGEGIANAVYALASTGTSSPASFKAPAAATGLYLAGLQHAMDSQDAASRAALKRAKALARRAALKELIDEALY